jgi:hypothetical protein
MEHVRGELPECCLSGHDRAACCFTMIVDTGQHGFLCYCLDLGLTAGVACRTVHRVYLVVQDAHVSYSLGLAEFCEWRG